MDPAAESILIGRYMLGCEPPRELQERYVVAHHILCNEQGQPAVSPELQFVHRHPWALPFIDAGAGLLQPASVVRKKIFLMTAILEATPVYAEFFLPRREPVLQLLLDLTWQALRGGLKIAIGLPLFLWARRVG